MSQNSTTSYTFTPINVDNGDGDGKPKATTRLDKQVDSVQRLQSNADLLKSSIQVVDDVLDTLDGIIFNGKRSVFNKLNGLKATLANVGQSIHSNAVALSPIPSMGYAYSRSRRSVSPDTIENSSKHNSEPI